MREERGGKYLIIKHPLRVRYAYVMPQPSIRRVLNGISNDKILV